MLRDWLIAQGLTFDFSDNMSGEELVNSLSRSLTAANFDFDEQRNILLQAPDHYRDAEFLDACIARADYIGRLQNKRRELIERHLSECKNGVSGKRVRMPAAEVARLRFAAAWPLRDEVFDIVDDMILNMAKHGYLESTPSALVDLRQGFGYYRPDEDPVRLRAPVRWLRNQNALHWWISALMGARNKCPLIKVDEGGAGCWVTAASIFADCDGHAYTNEQLEHGRPSSQTQRDWLDSTVPLRKSGCAPAVSLSC